VKINKGIFQFKKEIYYNNKKGDGNEG